MVRIDSSKLQFNPHNDLTIYQVEDLAKELLQAIVSAQEVSVNLSKTEKIDTAGFQLIVSLQKNCEALGKKFEIIGINGSVKNFMNLYQYSFNNINKGDT